MLQKTFERLDLISAELLDQPLIAMNIFAINWNFGRARVKHIRQLPLEQALLYIIDVLSKVCNRKAIDKEAPFERRFCKSRCFKNSCSGVHKIPVKNCNEVNILLDAQIFMTNFCFCTDLVLTLFLYEPKRLLYIAKSASRLPFIYFTLLYAQKQAKTLYFSFCLELLYANFQQTFFVYIVWTLST